MRFLLLIQNADVRQSNFRRTFQDTPEAVINYLANSDVLEADGPAAHHIYEFCAAAQVGQNVMLRAGSQGRRMIEIYAIAAPSGHG